MRGSLNDLKMNLELRQIQPERTKAYLKEE